MHWTLSSREVKAICLIRYCMISYLRTQIHDTSQVHTYVGVKKTRSLAEYIYRYIVHTIYFVLFRIYYYNLLVMSVWSYYHFLLHIIKWTSNSNRETDTLTFLLKTILLAITYVHIGFWSTNGTRFTVKLKWIGLLGGFENYFVI